METTIRTCLRVPVLFAVLLVALLAELPRAYAQGETNFWYFGHNAGLNFNIPPATPNAPAEITTSAMAAFEGSAVASDRTTGALLFYTNGINVWDRTNTQMTGGPLGGQTSSIQPALIVPDPGNLNRYYVFTSLQDGQLGPASYGIVDMTLNGGLGNIPAGQAQITLPTVNGTPPFARVAEKLAAKLDAAGTGYWIVYREWDPNGSNRFHAYHLSAAGIDGLQVSSTGPNVGGSPANVRGEMKISPDGQWMVAANETVGVHLFRFNRTTGAITFVTTLHNAQAFGVSFSPNSQLVYANDGWQATSRNIFQWDLSNPSPAAIAASRLTIGTDATGQFGGMQIAPDGRIYVAKNNSQTIGVINCPNVRGAGAGYDSAGFTFTGTRRSSWGMPNIILEAVATPEYAGPDTAICVGQSAQLGTTARAGLTYTWTQNPTLSNPNIAAPTASPTTTTEYYVTVTNPFGCVERDTVVVTVNPLPTVDPGQDVELCLGESRQLAATSNDPTATFAWEPNTGLSNPNVRNPTVTPTAAGTVTYTVTVTSAAGCARSDSMRVTTHPLPALTLDPEATICADESIQLQVTGGPGLTYRWRPEGTLSDPNIANPVATPAVSTVYTVVATNANGCVDSAQISVTVQPRPTATVSPDVAICPGDQAQLTASGGASYRWEPTTGLSNPAIANPLASPPATTAYSVIVTNAAGCHDTANVVVTVNVPPVATVTPSDTICAGKSIQLVASGGVRYRWSPGLGLSDSTVANPVASPLQTTTYRVIVESPEGCLDTAETTITVLELGLSIALPDTTGDPHDKNYRLPIRASVTAETLRCVPDSVTLTISFNSSMFSPRVVEGGRIARRVLAGENLVLTMVFPGSALLNPTGVLGTLIGNVMLGNSLSTPLRIDSVSADDLVVDATLVDGSLALDSICREGGDRLLRQRASVVIKSIAPNPSMAGSAAPAVHVLTWTLETASIELFTHDGQLVWSNRWQPERQSEFGQGVEQVIRLPKDVPSGMYLVVVRTNDAVDSRPVVIAR